MHLGAQSFQVWNNKTSLVKLSINNSEHDGLNSQLFLLKTFFDSLSSTR